MPAPARSARSNSRCSATALLAYALARDCWSAGYATEACAAAIAHLAAATTVRCVVAEIDTRNGRSCALVERLGFVRVARIADADFFKGAASHEYRYELTL